MIEIDTQQDLDKEVAGREKVIVLFYASWCGFCDRFVPVFENKMSSYKDGSVVYVLLDDYDNPMWDEYKIRAVPTVLFFEKGKVSSRLDAGLGSGLNERQLNVWLQGLSTP